MHTRRAARSLLAGAAAVLAVAGLAGCRTDPGVAAYVGDEKITVAALESAVDARLADGATYKAAVETISLKVPVGPDRRTPLRDVALLENLHSVLTAVLEEPQKAPVAATTR